MKLSPTDHSSIAIRSGDTLLEGLLETNLDPGSEGDADLLLPCLSVETLADLDL